MGNLIRMPAAVLSKLLLGILFFGLIAPAGVLCRLLGVDPLQRRLATRTLSYWVLRRPDVKPDRFFRQS
jgi:hypothetical protein